MLKLSLIVFSVLLVGCAPTTFTPINTGIPSATLEVQTESPLRFSYGFETTTQLKASQKGVWKLKEGLLPLGIQFYSDGILRGTASKLDETGQFTVEVAKGKDVATRTFRFSVQDVWWVNGAADIDVRNYRVADGFRAESMISVHNDYSLMTEQKKVITEPIDVPDENGFITVEIPIRQKLFDSAIGNVRSLVTSNTNDRLRVVSYNVDNNTLMIAGFAPLAERIISVEYVAEALFALQEYEANNLPFAYTIEIAEPSFYLKPHETKNILVAFEVPKGTKIPLKSFEVNMVAGKAYKESLGVNFVSRGIATWHVTMR